MDSLSIHSTLNPKSIAIVGASRHKDKVGYQVLKNIVTAGFKGKLYPINPNASTILGLKAYPTLSHLSTSPEMAIIITPASLVPAILDEASSIQVKVAIIISAGFAEKDHNGALLQSKLSEIVDQSNIRVIGPNCLGVLNTHSSLNATFGPPIPKKGNIMLISQSGAMVTGILDWASQHDLGLSSAITFGNRLDINENEALQYASQDKNTSTILLYLESFHNPQKFFSLASKVSAYKPIILLKGGQSIEGQTASASHTAALATDYALTKAFSQQTGVILTSNLHQFLNTASIFSISKPVKGSELAIITNAGGPGVVSTDEAVSSGLEVVSVTKNTKDLLEDALNINNPKNPIDILGDALPEDFKNALSIVDKDKIQDVILIIITPQTTTNPLKTAQLIAAYTKTASKPVYVVLIGGKKLSSAKKVLERSHIPVFDYPQQAIDLIKHRAFYYQSKINLSVFPKSKPSLVDQPTLKKLSKNLADDFSLSNGFKLLKSYGIKLPKYKIISNKTSIYSALKHTGLPAVLKTASMSILHKKKAGGVYTNMMNAHQAKIAFGKLSSLYDQVLVQQMIHSPIEIIIGAKNDKHFGTFVTVGLGGSFTDKFQDRAYAFFPTTKSYLKEVFSSTKAYKLFDNDPNAINQIVDIMNALGTSLLDIKYIEEIEINPILIAGNKAYAADLKITKKGVIDSSD